MLKRLKDVLNRRHTTTLLSLLFMGTSLYYGINFELQNRVDREVAALAAQHKTLSLSQYNPPAVKPGGNAAPLYLAAIDINSGSSVATQVTVQDSLDKNADSVREALAERAPTFTLLELAYSRPDCAYRYDLTNPNDHVPNFLGRSVAQLVDAKALLDIQAVHPQDAARELTHGVSFARRFHCGDTLINNMMRVVIDYYLMEAMQHLAHARVTADYSELLREWDLLVADNDALLQKSLDVERAVAFEDFQDPQRVLDAVGRQQSATTDDWLRWGATVSLYKVFGSLACLADRAYVLETFRHSEEGLRDLDASGYGVVLGSDATWGSPAWDADWNQQMAQFTAQLKQHHNALGVEPNADASHPVLMSGYWQPNFPRATFQMLFSRANALRLRQQLAALSVHP